MSFLKKMVNKFEDVVSGDDKKTGENRGGGKDESSHYGQQAPYGEPQPSAYGNQQQAFQAPPPAHSGSTAGPSLPPGWVAQWDQNSQRNYYLEQATGRTQWDPPQQALGSHGGYAPPAGPPIGPSGYESQGQHGVSGGYYSQEVTQTVDKHGEVQKEVHQTKEKSGKGGMLAGAAGGLAVGAVGGALVGHAMGDDSSDDEHKGYSHQEQPSYAQQTTYYQEGPPPPMAPPPGSDHGSVSSSDKEDLQESREEYENASASDREEAREEYEEQYEDTYGSD